MNDTGTSGETPLAARLAAKICSFDKRLVTQPALQQAKTCFIDTIGVTLAGTPEEATQILLRTPGIAEGPGQSLIFGTDRRTSALDATLVNGTASHAHDYDDFSSVFGGHQSVPLVSALLAMAEERKLSGEQVLMAYIVGVETEIRFARAVHFHHYDKGWHPTATLGTFGAAAALSHLLKLDAAQTTMALAIAASLAGGIKANFGTMTKPLHVGQCGRNGLLAVLLAQRGFDANASALEHHQGFLNVFNGPGTFNAEKLFEHWADPLEIGARSIALKQFPCCGSAHPAITMMLDLVRDHEINAEDAVKIEILPHGRRLRHTDKPHPKSPIEAKFSVQYVTARALLSGAVRLRDFEGDAFVEPAIVRLLDITEARAHPDMADDADEQWGAEVIVTLKDGRRLSKRIENLVGRGGENPMSADELWEKFSDCSQRVLPQERVVQLFEKLGALETIADINQLTRLMAADGYRRGGTSPAPPSPARIPHYSTR